MNTLALQDGFGRGFKTPERWQEGRGLNWLLRGGKKEEDPQLPFLVIPSVLLLHQLSDAIAGTMAKPSY